MHPVLLGGQEVPLLALGGEAGLVGCVEEDVAERVMAGNPLALLAAPDGVVTKDVGGPAAGDAEMYSIFFNMLRL